jgi:hypothetical protein
LLGPQAEKWFGPSRWVFGENRTVMRPVAFGEALLAGTRLTLFSDDKPERFFTIIKLWMDETSGARKIRAKE